MSSDHTVSYNSSQTANTSLYGVYLLDATSNLVTLTLEDVITGGNVDGVNLRIIRIGTSTNAVTIAATGVGSNIVSGGVTGTTLALAIGSEVTLTSLNGNWYGQVILSGTSANNQDTFVFNSNQNLPNNFNQIGFLQVQGMVSLLANEVNAQYLATTTTTQGKLVVALSVAPGGSSTRTFTVRQNGTTVATLVVSTTSANLSFNVNFVSGDKISLLCTNTGTGNPASSVGIASISLF